MEKEEDTYCDRVEEEEEEDKEEGKTRAVRQTEKEALSCVIIRIITGVKGDRRASYRRSDLEQYGNLRRKSTTRAGRGRGDVEKHSHW